MVHVLAHNKVITITLSSTRLAYALLYYILNFDMCTSTIDWEIFTVKIFSLVAIGMKIKHEIYYAKILHENLPVYSICCIVYMYM